LLFLQFSMVEVESKFQGKHEKEDEKSQEDCGAELGVPDAEEDAEDHYEWAEGGQWTEEEDAGGAAKIGGGHQAEGEIAHHQRGVREKNPEHAFRGILQIVTQENSILRDGHHAKQDEQRKPTGDLRGQNAAQNSHCEIPSLPDIRVAPHGSSASTERPVQGSQ